MKVKSEEVKNLIKQLEKEKVLSTELKHQLSEKDRQYSIVIAELEKSGNTISSKFEELTRKYNSLEGEFKTKNIEFETMKRSHEKVAR